MPWDPPSEQDPIAYLPWWLEFWEGTSRLLVLAWSDDRYRKTVLHAYARKAGGRVLTCRPHKSMKQFLQWLSSECGVFPGPRTSADLYGALSRLFLSANHLLILDDAHELSVSALGIVRDLHHHLDDDRQFRRKGVGTTTTFVLSSGSHELVKKLDKVRDFWAYCRGWRHYDVPLSKKQREFAQAIPRPPDS